MDTEIPTIPDFPHTSIPLMAHEWQALLEALRRDIQQSQQKLHTNREYALEHGYNARTVANVLDVIENFFGPHLMTVRLRNVRLEQTDFPLPPETLNGTL